MRLSGLILLCGMCCTIPAIAADSKEPQQQRAGAPIVGYAYSEETRQLRAILGVPGASRWSEPIALPDGVTAVRIANGHRWALTVSDGQTGVLDLESLRHVKLDDGASPDTIAFSPSGSAVALQRGSSVAVFGGLPDTPSALPGISEATGAIAVSEAGDVAMVRDGRLVRGSAGDALAVCGDGCRFAFLPGEGSVLAIWDGVQLNELRGQELRVIATGLPLESVERLAGSAARIALANKDRVVVVDRASGALIADEPVSGGSNRLEAMRLPGTWLLSAPVDGAAWLYSNDGVRFVPAAGSK